MNGENMNNNINNDTKKVELVDANLLNPFQTNGNNNNINSNSLQGVSQNNSATNENPINVGINNASTNMTVNAVNQNNSNIVNNNGNINNQNNNFQGALNINQNNNFQGTINNNQGVNGLNNAQNNNYVPPYNMQNNVNNNSMSNQPMNGSIASYMGNSTGNHMDLDTELLRAYIGPNAEKIMNQGISWPTFWLGIYYVLYRKMWLLAFILVIVSIVVTIFLPKLSIIISPCLGIGIFILFNKIYVNHAKTDINTIKLQNPNASKEELMRKCQIKGGTSIAAPIVYILVYSGLQMYATKRVDDSLYYNYVSSKENVSLNINSSGE